MGVAIPLMTKKVVDVLMTMMAIDMFFMISLLTMSIVGR
jgi:hypothetical protein